MAGNLSIKLSADCSEFETSINKAKEAIGGLNKAVNSNSGNSGLDMMRKKFEEIDNSSKPLKMKLKQLKDIMAQLNMEGQSNTSLYSELAQRAGEYKDSLDDAAAATSRFSSDTRQLDSAVAALQGIAAVGSIATGVMGSLGIKGEKVNAAILKVQSSMAILNGVQQLSNVLNKDSVLIQSLKALKLKVLTAATVANTVAETTNGVATKINTGFQHAWNVAKAVGKAICGDYTGLLIVGAAALLTYSLCTSDATEETKKQNKATEDNEKTLKNFRQTVNSSVGEMIGKYSALKIQWEQCRTEGEKTQYLKEHKSAIESLGFAVDDLNDLENLFVQNTSAVVRALTARAKAAAAEQLIVDTYKNYYENKDKATFADIRGDSKVYIGQNLNGKGLEGAERERFLQFKDKAQKDGKLNEYFDINGSDFVLNQKGLNAYLQKELKEYNSKQEAELNKTVEGFGKLYGEATSEYNDIVKDAGFKTVSTIEKENPKNTSPSNNKPTETNKNIVQEGSLKEAQIKYQEELKKLQEETNLQDEEAVKAQKEKVLTAEAEYNAKKKIAEIEKEKETKPTPTIDRITGNDNFEKGSVEDKVQSLGNAKSQSSYYSDLFNNGIISAEEFTNYIDELNKKLEELGLKPIDIKINGKGEITSVKQEAEDAITEYEQLLSTLKGMSGNMGNIIDSFKALGDVMENKNATAGEKIGASLNTVGQSLQALGANGAVAKAGAVMAAIGQAVLGFAVASAQAASMSPFVWLGFVATGLATLATIVTTIKGYASGGIVDGATSIGDYNIARVNGGEMIMNGSQQQRLWNIINGNSPISNAPTTGGQVVFKINGDALTGVLKNYNSKLSKTK